MPYDERWLAAKATLSLQARGRAQHIQVIPTAGGDHKIVAADPEQQGQFAWCSLQITDAWASLVPGSNEFYKALEDTLAGWDQGPALFEEMKAIVESGPMTLREAAVKWRTIKRERGLSPYTRMLRAAIQVTTREARKRR